MVSTRDVLLFVPNLIGYSRVVLTAASLYFATTRPLIFFALYWTGFLLDGLDGHAARALNQCSKFGAVLDMVTDRVATNALVIVLSHLYPTYMVHFVLLCSLDLGSHWFRMYSALLVGATSHKDTGANDGFIVTLYYTNRVVLALVCMFSEFFLISLYALHFDVFGASGWLRIAAAVAAPVFVLKQYISVIQLIESCRLVAEWDAEALSSKTA